MWWSTGSVSASDPPGPGSNLGPGPPHSVVCINNTIINLKKGFKKKLLLKLCYKVRPPSQNGVSTTCYSGNETLKKVPDCRDSYRVCPALCSVFQAKSVYKQHGLINVGGGSSHKIFIWTAA